MAVFTDPNAPSDGGTPAPEYETVVASGSANGLFNFTLTLDWDAIRANPGSVYEITIATGSRADAVAGPLRFRTSVNSAGVIEKWVTDEVPTDTKTYTHYAPGSYADRTLCNLPNWNWTNRGVVKMILTLDMVTGFSGYGLILVEHTQQQESATSFEKSVGVFSHHVNTASSTTIQFNLINKQFSETTYKLVRRQE